MVVEKQEPTIPENAANSTCLGPEVVEQHGGQVALPKAGQDDHDELALVLNALSKPADMRVSCYAHTAAASMAEFGFCIAATLSGDCACWDVICFLPSSPPASSQQEIVVRPWLLTQQQVVKTGHGTPSDSLSPCIAHAVTCFWPSEVVQLFR